MGEKKEIIVMEIVYQFFFQVSFTEETHNVMHLQIYYIIHLNNC